MKATDIERVAPWDPTCADAVEDKAISKDDAQASERYRACAGDPGENHLVGKSCEEADKETRNTSKG